MVRRRLATGWLTLAGSVAVSDPRMPTDLRAAPKGDPMSEQFALLIKTFPVGKWWVTLTFRHPPAALSGAPTEIMTAEWFPRLPPSLSRKEWRQYRAGRDAAIAEYGEVTGLKIALVEP